MRRVLFQNNLIYNISMTNPGCISNLFPLGMDIAAAFHSWPNVTVMRNAGGTQATVQIYQGATVNISAISITANVVSVTTAAMPQAMIGGSTWVQIAGVTPSGYNGKFVVCTTPTTGCAVPTTTSFTYQLTASLASGSTGTAESFVGESQTGVITGEPISVTSCVDSTFNAGPNPPVLAIAAVPSGTTVTYANVGTANASTTCTFRNSIGAPHNLTVNHNTVVGDLLALEPSSSSLPSGSSYPAGLTVTNNIFTGGGWKGANTANEGTASQNQYYDTTSMVAHHNVQSDRTVMGNWTLNTAYRIGDRINPASGVARTFVAVTSGTSGGTQPTFTNGANNCITDNTVTWQNVNAQFGGASSYTEYDVVNVPIVPPTTFFFPKSAYTYGASATPDSVGFVGGLNAPTTGTNSCTGAQVPAASIQPIFNLATWTQYGLDSTSSFHNAASDSTDMGADMTKINAAQTATQYVCKTSCGTGPYPD
jgi:hypothetical protein